MYLVQMRHDYLHRTLRLASELFREVQTHESHRSAFDNHVNLLRAPRVYYSAYERSWKKDDLYVSGR
jgi:hypothetical protein